MPDGYARAVHELVRAKIEQRAPEIVVEQESKPPQVINIMDALKKSMKPGPAKVREAVRKQVGKAASERAPAPRSAARPKPSTRRPAH